MIGNGERKARDDDVGEGLARDVHSHPEAIGPKKDARDILFKGCEELVARLPVSLHEEIVVHCLEEARDHEGGALLFKAVDADKGFALSVLRHCSSATAAKENEVGELTAVLIAASCNVREVFRESDAQTNYITSKLSAILKRQY